MSEDDQTASKSRRGGKRAGAGRKPKGFKAPSSVAGLNLVSALASAPPEEIDGVAQKHARMAIEALVKQLIHGASEAAKVAAAKAILDRGYGKPAVEIGGDAAMLPFMAAPSVAPTTSADIRSEARKYANLAIEVLKKIADAGVSEAAKVSAATAILERGLGTVGKARMPDEMRDRPLGKKEEAMRAAEAGATGRYATPPPPRALTSPLQ